jgi:hypothetical protein
MSDKSWFYSAMIELNNAARAIQPPDERDKTIKLVRRAMDEHALEQEVIDAVGAWILSEWTEDGTRTESWVHEAYEALDGAREGSDV